MESLLRVENRLDLTWSQSPLSGLLDQLAKKINAKVGAHIQPFSGSSILSFHQLSAEKQGGLVGTVQGLLSLLDVKSNDSANPEEHPEREHVEMALKFFGMELRDDIWKHISPNEIIEIYDSSDIQVFRTLNFFKASSYTLLDLLTYEWFHLWQRPSVILEKMMNLGQRLHSSINGIEPAGIPRHILKEILEDKENGLSSRKSIQIDFNVVCPLYRKDKNERAGYIVTCLATVLDEGKDIDTVAFL